MENTQKSFFNEENAALFEEPFFSLWPKRIALNWFWIAFQALESSGDTYYETDDQEIVVREKLTLLFILYYEFCYISAKHESSNFKYCDEQTIKRLKNDISENADDHLFAIRKSLIKYFGSEEKVIAELWINCVEGANNCFMKMEVKNKMFNQIINSDYDDVNYRDVLSWFIAWNNSIEDFEGIAI